MNAMKTKLFHGNQTSAHLLAAYATERLEGADDPRLLLTWDLFIKARSYALLNKVAFVLSVAFGAAVILWPALGALAAQAGQKLALLESPVLQTTITALAAASFGFYGHYKTRQLEVENLMRRVLFAKDFNPTVVESVLTDLQRIDAGFAFSDALFSGGDGQHPTSQTEPLGDAPDTQAEAEAKAADTPEAA